jgi:hypothetical protein
MMGVRSVVRAVVVAIFFFVLFFKTATWCRSRTPTWSSGSGAISATLDGGLPLLCRSWT